MTSEREPLTPAARRLIEENVLLVDHITKRVAASFPRHVDREELARAGMLGLVEAAARFDPGRGRFPSFAGRRIEGAILDEVRRRTWAPRSVRSAARHLSSVEDELTHQLGQRPDEEQLSSAAGMTPAQLAQHRRRAAVGFVDTLDRPANLDGETTVADMVKDPSARPIGEELEEEELHTYLRSAVSNLPERHRLVIVGYFIEGRSMEELAELLGVSQSRVSQLKDFAVALMRGAIEAQYREGEPTPGRSRAERSRAAYAASVSADASRHLRRRSGGGRRPPTEQTSTGTGRAAIAGSGGASPIPGADGPDRVLV